MFFMLKHINSNIKWVLKHMFRYETLTKSQKSSFRAKKSYWKNKGLTEQQAYEKAAQSYLKIAIVKTHELDSVPPSSKKIEVLHEQEMKKALNVVKERTIIDDKSKCEDEKDPLISSRIDPVSQCPKIINATFYATIVTLASWLLIQSSLEIFGNTPEGWCKAILLELGILGLASSKFNLGTTVNDLLSFILSKSTLLFLLILSFAVLHTGVESQRSEHLTSAESTNSTLASLIKERDDWQNTHDSYATNRVTDRRDAMKEISRLNAEIRVERASLSQNLNGSVIHLKSNTEMMLRAALLLLNIIYGHKLVRTMAKMKWPPIREERLA